ncbi:MAG: hypothetical protein QXN71_03180, partial [Candidatus Aenigmatarchaeota archaeon]
TSFTCNNGRQDPNEEGIDCGGSCPERCGIPYNWLLLAGGVIILILTIAFLQFKGEVRSV